MASKEETELSPPEQTSSESPAGQIGNGHESEENAKDAKGFIATEFDPVSSMSRPVNELPVLSPVRRVTFNNIDYTHYSSEAQMPAIMDLIQKDLSEPYSIYTYRYFIHNWPKLCLLAWSGDELVGAIVCKLDMHKRLVQRGYIAMLTVSERFRKRKIGTTLVTRAILEMFTLKADEVVLETEMTDVPALTLYENLGFVRDKRLFRYYLNGVDAFRLKLWFK